VADEDIDIEINVDTGRGVDDLTRLGTASKDAGTELDKLDQTARGVDPSVSIDVDVDVDRIDKAGEAFDKVDRKGRGMADGVGFGNNALRDLTGPLGDSTGAAGDMGDAFEGLGDIVGGLGAKLGLGEEAVGKLSGAVAGVGVVVAAGIAAWNLYKTAQENARRESEQLLEVQKLLAESKYTDAAQKLAEDYAGTIRQLERFGLKSGDLVATLRGEGSAISELQGRYDELGVSISEASAEGANPAIQSALRAQRDEVGLVIGNLQSYQSLWKTSGEDIAENDRIAGELSVALGGVTEEAGKATESVKAIALAFDDLTEALDDQSAIEDVRDAFDNVEDAAIEAWNAAAEGAPEAGRKMRDYQQSVRDAIEKVLGLGDELDNLPDETIASIAVAVNDGDLGKARAILEGVAADLPPVKIGIDSDYLTQQFQNWLRSSGPGSSSLNPSPAPGGGGGPAAGVVGGGSRRAQIVNYYPPRLSPIEQSRAERSYIRVQGG
jgi:hypothetical protein